MNLSLRHVLVGVAWSYLAAGCAETPSEQVYDAYQGDAYPETREPVDYPSAGAVVVANTVSDQLSLVDRAAGTVFATAPIGRDPVSIDGPTSLVVDQAAGVIYTVYTYPVAPSGVLGPHGELSQLTPRFGYVHALALDDFGLLGEVRVDAAPGSMIMSEDGSRLVVSHHDLLKVDKAQGSTIAARANLAVVDVAALTAGEATSAARIPSCAAPHGVALAGAGADLGFVACYGEDSIAIVDLNDAEQAVMQVQVGPAPGPLGEPAYGPMTAQLSPDGSMLAVGCVESTEVLLFARSGASLTAAGRVAVAGAPGLGAWSSDGAQLVVPTRVADGVDVIDVASATVVASQALASSECLRPVELQRDGDALWAVCAGDGIGRGQLLRLDLSSLQPQVGAEVGVGPSSLALVDGVAP